MARKKKKKIVETLGHVVVAQIPMIITFDEDHVEFVADYLESAMNRSYEIIDMFGDLGGDFDPFDDEG
jgi:hypothetical protein